MNALGDTLQKLVSTDANQEQRLQKLEARYAGDAHLTTVPIITNVVVDFSTGDLMITWDEAAEQVGIRKYDVRVIKEYT